MPDRDRQAITKIIDRMYEALCFSPERPPDWDAFRSVFLKEAGLFPAARPAGLSALGPFIARMGGMREAGDIVHFDEEKFKDSIHVFGNIAVAFSSYASTIDKDRTSRGVNAMLLVKDGGEWRCAAMAWDGEGEGKSIPAEYL